MAEYQKQKSDLVVESVILILAKKNLIVWGHSLSLL
jgi:hypothetical protein